MSTLRMATRWLWRSMDRQARYLALRVILLGALGACLAAAAPIALKLAVDAMQIGAPPQSHSIASLYWTLIYVAGLWLAKLLGEWRTLAQGRASQRIRRRAASSTFEHLMHLPMRFHLRSRTGAVSDAVEQGLRGHDLILEPVLGTLLPALFELVAACLVLARFAHAEYLAILAGAVVVFAWVLTHRSLSIREPAEQVIQAHVQASGTFVDALTHVESVKAFGANREVSVRYAAALAAVESAWCTFLRKRVRSSMTSSVILTAALACSLSLATYQVERQTLTLGEFVLVHAYVLRLLQPLETVGYAIRDVAQGIASLASLDAILRVPDERAAQTGTRCPKASSATLEFEHVSFSYEPGRRALNDVSFRVPAGRTVAIVGANGSGKSTLIRLLLRLYEPDAGRIRLGGTPIDQFDATKLRECIALVPQDTALLHDTLANNIAFGTPRAMPDDIQAAARVAGLHDFIQALPEGYDTLAGERGLRLSGGERQRIAIARAVLRRAHLLLFDEATSALDSRTEALVRRQLALLSENRTTLVVAHRLASIATADEIVVLHEGRVVESGTHAGLLRSQGRYAALWAAQHALSTGS